MLKHKRKLLIAILACITTCSTISLNGQTDSPYSRYGLGSLRSQATGPSKGMGGVGYGLHTSQSANPLNPASYAQVDSLTFIFDIGVNYNNTSYKEGVNSSSKSNGGLDYITALFPVSKQLGISFGILPFSSTGYKLGSLKSVKNEHGQDTYYRTQHDGSGGLSQVYVGLGYKLPIKGLSVGANASYLFGNLKHTNAITSIGGGASDLNSQFSKLNVTSVKIDLGLQYKIELKERSSVTLGAVYTPKINGRGKLLRSEYVIGPGGNVINEEIINNETIATGTPHIAGVGFIYNHKRRVLIGADVTYERWKGAKFSNLLADDLSSNQRFNNRWKIAIGAEYRIAEFSKNFFQKMKFRGGFNYSNSYVNVNTTAKVPKGYDEYGATLGFGLPIIDKEELGGRTSYLNINFEYKYLKPGLSSMVKEKFFGVSLNMNINELWFYQRKIR